MFGQSSRKQKLEEAYRIYRTSQQATNKRVFMWNLVGCGRAIREERFFFPFHHLLLTIIIICAVVRGGPAAAAAAAAAVAAAIRPYLCMIARVQKSHLANEHTDGQLNRQTFWKLVTRTHISQYACALPQKDTADIKVKGSKHKKGAFRNYIF